MDLREFVASIPGFSGWSSAQQIRFFAWWLHTYEGKGTFDPKHIRNCFDRLHLDPPSSVSPFLNQMEKSRPRKILKSTQGWKLEGRVRSEFDSKFGRRSSTILVDSLLSGLPDHLPGVERTYLQEAITCFRHGATRAAIVMTWNLAYDHLCEWVLAHHLSAFNAQLPITFRKPKLAVINTKDDFAEFKESEVIQITRSAQLISANVQKVLKEKLDRRNLAAHPSGVIFEPVTAEEFIKDLIQNVVLKLK